MRLRRSRLTDEQGERLLEHFVAGTSARTAAELVGVNRNTARLFYHRMRKLIVQRLARVNPLKGEIELDETCIRDACEGKRNRGATDRVPLFALLKRSGKVYTVMVPKTQRERPLPTQRIKVQPDSIVCTVTPDVHDVQAVSRFRHQRIDQRQRLVAGRSHINSVENFWNQAKRQLRRYNGVPRQHFDLFLKECEWRFNYGSPKQLLTTLKSWIKASSG